MLPNIHLIGIQGSGKGTQAALLVKRFELTYLGAGNMFRQRAAVGDDFGKLLHSMMQAGSLLPVPIISETVLHFLSQVRLQRGILGDGIIRTLDQKKMLAPIWEHYKLGSPLLINLHLNEEEAHKRIIKRSHTKEVHRKHHQQYSGKLVQRDDDNPAAIAERFSTFRKLTEPVISAFEEEGRCHTVDASQDIQKVFTDIEKIILHHYPSFRHEFTQKRY